MTVAVADTHTALWYLFDDTRLSLAAKLTIEHAVARGAKVAVSSISLAEVVYLCEKGRIAAEALGVLMAALKDTGKVFVETPLDSEIVQKMRAIPRDEVPDLPDRIVAATALHLGVPVISRDGKIRAAGVETIW